MASAQPGELCQNVVVNRALQQRLRPQRAGRGPERRGFGTTVLENMVGRALGAEVRRTLHDDGIEWSFSVPVEALDPARDPHGETDLERPAPLTPPAAPPPPAEEK